MTTHSDEPPELDLNAAQMTLLGHLNVLRIRLTYAAVALFVCTIIGFALAHPIL
jgi:hypothetical protein